MSSTTISDTTDAASAIKALRLYLLEKGHTFERAPSYQALDQTPMSVSGMMKMYEGMGYTKVLQFGNPTQYALLERGHQEMHILHLQDPQVREWIENHEKSLNDLSMRAYLAQSIGLNENDIPAAEHPRHFRISQVGDVYLIGGANAA